MSEPLTKKEQRGFMSSMPTNASGKSTYRAYPSPTKSLDFRGCCGPFWFSVYEFFLGSKSNNGEDDDDDDEENPGQHELDEFGNGERKADVCFSVCWGMFLGNFVWILLMVVVLYDAYGLPPRLTREERSLLFKKHALDNVRETLGANGNKHFRSLYENHPVFLDGTTVEELKAHKKEKKEQRIKDREEKKRTLERRRKGWDTFDFNEGDKEGVVSVVGSEGEKDDEHDFVSAKERKRRRDKEYEMTDDERRFFRHIYRMQHTRYITQNDIELGVVSVLIWALSWYIDRRSCRKYIDGYHRLLHLKAVLFVMLISRLLSLFILLDLSND